VEQAGGRFFPPGRGDRGGRRLEQVTGFLRQEGVLAGNSVILDVGCGPGGFAIPFAEEGHSVVALDPAEKMLDILRGKLSPENSGRVTTVLGLWEEMDVKEMGWEKRFDLVFASMTPGVCDLETLEKMNACSRKWCYLSNFSGPRLFSLFEEIYLELLGKPFANHVNDIIFPFNLLYTLGYRPRLAFNEMNQQREDSVEEAVEDVLENFQFFAGNHQVSGLVRKVCDLVEKKSGER
jgi:Methylase involved in ubiquinone/menaquinone biosynthesis